MTAFIKKDWSTGETITESDMDRLEDGVQEAFTSAAAAKDSVDAHVLDTSIHVNQDILDVIAESGATPGGGRILTTLDISNIYDIPNNYEAVVDPLTSDDDYVVGSVWVNVSNDRAFICTDNTNNAAIWKDITASGSLVSGSGTGVHNDLTGIQGGSAGNYYHLTAAQSSALIAHLTDYSNPHQTATGATGYVTLDALGYLEREQIPRCNLRNIFNAPFEAQTTPEDNNWRGICWSPKLRIWCAVSTNGTNRVMTSVDGKTWVSRTAASANNWADVCWSEELEIFVAVAYSDSTSNAMTSPDGITWTSRTTPNNNWTSVVWAPELTLFVAVSNDYNSNQTVMTSPNGITWTARTAAEYSYWEDVCWSPELELFVAVSGVNGDSASANDYRCMTSPDGITWTGRALPSEVASNQWGGVEWSPTLGMFAAVSYTGTYRVMTSTDGVTWTARSAANANNWYKIIWSPEFQHFVACSITGTGNRIMYSRDGINWYTGTSANDYGWYTLGYSTTLAQVVCLSTSGTGNRCMTSPDIMDYAIDGDYAKVGQFNELYVDTYPVLTSKENIKSVTTAYTATVNDRVILGNGTFSITLPLASRASGITYTIKNIGTGTVTIDGNGSETIDGATTKVLSSQYAVATIVSNGTAWYVL